MFSMTIEFLVAKESQHVLLEVFNQMNVRYRISSSGFEVTLYSSEELSKLATLIAQCLGK